MTSANTLLDVQDLRVSFRSDDGVFDAVSGLNFELAVGKTLALVGESGCGKSVTSLAIMNLLPENGLISDGQIRFMGRNLVPLSFKEMAKIRGNDIAMIFQEPMTALNPVYTIGQQVGEVFKIHHNLSRKEINKHTQEILERVKIPEAEKRMREYPFQLSGGMRQRVLIAMALACNPKILIADEPTTALDVTIQAQIIALIKELQEDMQMGILFITHDLGVVAEIADDVMVMYGGKVVEKANADSLFTSPEHPYTQALLASIPKPGDSKENPLATIPGMVPSIKEQFGGCRFRNRCPHAYVDCEKVPQFKAIDHEHSVACHLRNSDAPASAS
ncbi:MAG: ABC transporter ATP-binding protein [Oligoflexales bacterium]|nr:ABC transporter ATP-binding protein [Oligoflexales bacterium]